MRRCPAAHDYDGWVAQLAVPSCHRRAKCHLLEVGPPALAAVRRGLQRGKPAVRLECVNLLDHFVDDETLGLLVAAVDDDDPRVRARALHALSCDRCKEGACRPGEDLWVPRALALLRDAAPDLRAAAIDALGKVVARRPEVAAALAGVAERDPDKGLRGMARWRVPAAAGAAGRRDGS